jgi:hypothetical protein
MVSSDQVIIDVLVNTATAEAELESLGGKIDSTVATWKAHRTDIMLGINAVNQMIMITARLASNTADEVGRAMLKTMQSLMAVVNATTSAMIAVAAAYMSTGVLAGIGAIVAGFAAGFSMGQSVIILGEQAKILADIQHIRQRLDSIEVARQAQSSFGGL